MAVVTSGDGDEQKSPGENAGAAQSMAEEEGFEPSYPEG
jgi:hypothetical protein